MEIKNKITVIDAIMGKGKTTWAINHLNDKQNIDDSFIYVTPYRKEIERLQKNVNMFYKTMYEPELLYDDESQTSRKLFGLIDLLNRNYDIATTHHMFMQLDERTKQLIKDGHYTLILDEVIEPLSEYEIAKLDIEILKSKNEKGESAISIDDKGYVHWNTDVNFKGNTKFYKVRNLARTNSLMCIDGKFFIWVYPPEIFKLFDKIYILTYLFDSSILKGYFDAYNIDYEMKSLDKGKLCEYYEPDHSHFKKLINIYDGKLNEKYKKESSRKKGRKTNPLSTTWYKNNPALISQLANDNYNYYRNCVNSSSEDFLWTCPEEYREKISRNGYKDNWLAFNTRATNDYSNKHKLSYLKNVYIQPGIEQFFNKYKVNFNQDKYALSILIQWIWRSAIRNNEPISIFIPSKRMRDILIMWLNNEKIKDKKYAA